MHEKYLEKAEKRLYAAEVLIENDLYEDAVSRAYYSMYFATKALFSLKDIYTKTHRGLLAKFGLVFVNEGLIEEYYSKALRIAEELREDADYSLVREITKEEAEAIVQDAEKFLQRIKKAIKDMKGGEAQPPGEK